MTRSRALRRARAPRLRGGRPRRRRLLAAGDSAGSRSSVTAGWTSPATSSMYRTQINDRPGLLLRSFNYTSDGAARRRPSRLLPASTPRTSARARRAGCACRPAQSTSSSSTFTWRQTDLYSALPAFANPFLAEGIIPGQQTYNRHAQHLRRDAAAPSRQDRSRPILGYTRNTYSGPGTTTYHLGGNEFQLNDQVNSVDELYRLGLGFEYGPVQGGVTQGWRYFRWNRDEHPRAGRGRRQRHDADPRAGRHRRRDRVRSRRTRSTRP